MRKPNIDLRAFHLAQRTYLYVGTYWGMPFYSKGNLLAGWKRVYRQRRSGGEESNTQGVGG